MNYICEICGIEFNTFQEKANHVRWQHKDEDFYETYKKNLKEAKKNQHIKNLGDFKPFIVICECCGKEFGVIEREKKHPEKEKYFCGRSCANKRYHTNETKKNISKSIKKLWKSGKYDELHLTESRIKMKFTSKGEDEIKTYFINNFKEDCWAFGGSIKHNNIRISRDLYSNKLKVCIEYDGIWHFKDIHGQLNKKQIKDLSLEEWCVENDYKLIRIREEIYQEDKEKWINILVNEAYNGKAKIIKFY